MTLDDFIGCPCWVGVDLADKIDLAAVVIAFERDRQVYVPEPRFYCPEERCWEKEFSHYAAWATDGYITATDGAMIDQDAIFEDLVAIHRKTQCGIAFDPRGAAGLIGRLQGQNIEAIEIPQTTNHLSAPTDTVLALVKDGKLWHDGNPVLAWCVANVRAKRNAQDLVYPTKERPEKRIDGAIGLIMAVSMLELPQESTEIAGDLVSFA